MEEAKRKAKANWKLPLRGEEGGMFLSRRRLTPGNSEKAEKKAERASERANGRTGSSSRLAQRADRGTLRNVTWEL